MRVKALSPRQLAERPPKRPRAAIKKRQVPEIFRRDSSNRRRTRDPSQVRDAARGSADSERLILFFLISFRMTHQFRPERLRRLRGQQVRDGRDGGRNFSINSSKI